MDLIRIGAKIISRRQIMSTIDKILEMRSSGIAQQEIANRLGVDRPFISRLEALGEIRKGQRIAVIGFPIQNKAEIQELLDTEGIEFSLIMTEKERWNFVKNSNGLDLLNKIMQLMAEVRNYNIVIVIGSNKRIKIIEAILDKEVIGLEIGESPIEEDKYVDPIKLSEVLNAVKSDKFKEDIK